MLTLTGMTPLLLRSFLLLIWTAPTAGDTSVSGTVPAPKPSGWDIAVSTNSVHCKYGVTIKPHDSDVISADFLYPGLTTVVCSPPGLEKTWVRGEIWVKRTLNTGEQLAFVIICQRHVGDVGFEDKLDCCWDKTNYIDFSNGHLSFGGPRTSCEYGPS